MTNLIAYIPVLHQGYVEWLLKHPQSNVWLVRQCDAAELIPGLARDMRAIDSQSMCSILNSQFCFSNYRTLYFSELPNLEIDRDFILPDEDLSHEIAQKHLKLLEGAKIFFENVFLRWDMSAVKRQEPILPDLEVSSEKVDQLRMEAAKRLGQKSPDWWRQIGALAFRDGEMIACAYNKHYPTEYEAMIFGDPRINFNAGDPAGAEVYLSNHAEEGIILACAAKGVALQGAFVYVTTFPCGGCARKLAACHIKKLFFSEGYSALGGLRTLQVAGIRIVKVKDPGSA